MLFPPKSTCATHAENCAMYQLDPRSWLQGFTIRLDPHMHGCRGSLYVWIRTCMAAGVHYTSGSTHAWLQGFTIRLDLHMHGCRGSLYVWIRTCMAAGVHYTPGSAHAWLQGFTIWIHTCMAAGIHYTPGSAHAWLQGFTIRLDPHMHIVQAATKLYSSSSQHYQNKIWQISL